MIQGAIIEITKESGEILNAEKFPTELGAQQTFDEMEKIRYPLAWKGLYMNLSEWPEGNIGSVRLVAIDDKGERYIRRELYRKP